MKKHLCMLLAVLILLSACGNAPSVGNTPVPTEPPVLETETVPVTEPPAAEPETTPGTEPPAVQIMLPLPQEPTGFAFLSGAGAWVTILTLNTDGSFTGQYHDSEMGDRSDVYPNGSVYLCNFSGSFDNFEQLNAYSYRMTLSAVETEHAVGEEWIEDDIRYVASDPFGLETGTEFILYLPDTPVEAISEEFLSWWPYRYEQMDNPKDTLSCYGILNTETQYGFFH